MSSLTVLDLADLQPAGLKAGRGVLWDDGNSFLIPWRGQVRSVTSEDWANLKLLVLRWGNPELYACLECLDGRLALVSSEDIHKLEPLKVRSKQLALVAGRYIWLANLLDASVEGDCVSWSDQTECINRRLKNDCIYVAADDYRLETESYVLVPRSRAAT